MAPLDPNVHSMKPDRAERQFMLADPENRLVVRSLESNWNQKLKELEKAKTGLCHIQFQKSLDPLRKRRTGHSGSRTKDSGDLERTNIYAKKKRERIIRILIDDVTVLAEKRCSDFSIGIRFRSGKCEHLSLKKNLPYGDRRKHADNTISKIRELAATMDDHEIADQLNQNGLTTPEGRVFTYAGVRWIRYKHSISGPYQRNRMGISVAEAATLLNISTGKVYYGISYR